MSLTKVTYSMIDGAYVNVKDFGAVGNGVTDDTAAIQAAIDYATANGQQVFCPEGPYLITTIDLSCRLVGTIRSRFGGTGANQSTFVSAVGAGVYAIEYTGISGSLEAVTLTNTGAGNGINASSVSTQTAMKDVYVVTTFTLATGSGSIGVSYGSDASPGTQAITCVFDTVVVRGYDICHRMRYYSNSNIYRKCYALNTTSDPATKSTAGYLVDGRGAHFDGCLCESNFDYALNESSIAEENIYSNFWTEGVSGLRIGLGGVGSIMINPYGFVGTSTFIPITKSAYATVIKKRGPKVSVADFNQGVSENLVSNAEFTNGLGGLSWSNATPSGALFGYNALSIESAGAATSVTSDHVVIDLDLQPWLRGKTVTYACFGQANDAGVSMSIRGIIRTSGGTNLQYATSEPFDDSAAGLQKISVNIPEDAATAKLLVFRIFASGVTSGTPSVAGKIALPMIFVGNDLQNMEARHLTDGANTVYGSQTYQGGGWDTAHIVLGSNHLWVDSTGDLRIKSSAPTSDTDGTVVGTQS